MTRPSAMLGRVFCCIFKLTYFYFMKSFVATTLANVCKRSNLTLAYKVTASSQLRLINRLLFI